MQPKHGTITINGITEADLIRIIQIKERWRKALQFNPQQLQPIFEQRPGAGQQLVQWQVGYDGAVFTWGSEGGLTAILELLHALDNS